MDNTRIAIWSVVVMCSVLGAAAFFGLTPFGRTIIEHTTEIVDGIGGPSASSASINIARFAGTAGISLASPGTTGATGANGTSTSILNPDATDRYISSIKAGCEVVGASRTAYSGTGLASLTLSVATSSTSGPSSNAGNSNVVGGGTVVIGTSTAQYAVSTSTIGTGSPNIYAVWASGSYLTFTTNATNTATCTFGADYFQS